MPNITTNHAITYTNALLVGVFCSSSPINESIHYLVKFTYFSLHSLHIFSLAKRLPLVNFETYHRSPQISELSGLICIGCARNA